MANVSYYEIFANFIPTFLQENAQLPKRLNQKTKERQRHLLLVRSFHLETEVNLLAFCLLGFHLFLFVRKHQFLFLP